MKSIFTKVKMIFLCFTLAFIVAGCDSSANDSDSISGLNPNEIVPSKEILVENLEDNGYTTTEHTAVNGVDLMIDRIVSEKGNKFYDVCTGSLIGCPAFMRLVTIEDENTVVPAKEIAPLCDHFLYAQDEYNTWFLE